MRKPIAVVGIDPGFASVGVSLLELRRERLQLISLHVIHTKKATKKANVLSCEDTFERAREIAIQLRRLMSPYDVLAVCAESMSFPRSSAVAAKMAMSWGVLADITVTERLPLVQPSPQRVKRALCGVANASKEDVQRAVGDVLGEPFRKALESIRAADREHAADATACVLASRDSDVFRLIGRVPS